MRIDVGIIGGTGIGDRLMGMEATLLHVPTPHGTIRGRRIEIGGKAVMLLSRHSAGHKVPPHLVNYRAMAAGLAAAGATACLATAAVGSLREDWPCGTMVVCSDFLDFTARNVTLHEATVVHTDFSTPFGERTTSALLDASESTGPPVRRGVYVCGNGPRYETPREISLYHDLGGDIVGMTAATEAIVMREAGIDYSCLSVVTNLACGIAGRPLSHEEVVEEMERSGEKAVDLLLEAVRRIH